MADPRYEVLRVAMRKIAWPIKALQEYAEDQGHKLDVHMAVQIVSNPHYFQDIAQEAMAEIAMIDPTGVNDRPRPDVGSPSHPEVKP